LTVTNCTSGRAQHGLLRTISFGCISLLLATSSTVVVGQDAQEASWARTVSRVADSVVSLQLSQLRDFDDSRQGGSSATGFVVDAERGIVLTNRHVVGSGPMRLSATFQNQERVDAVPLYRDPIHDFAFVRFDPTELQYAMPASLSLRPDKVRTGMNIRVIGSDGGEQLSILPGTIARLDREVPSYGRYGYNDFNTFYMQAASGTSGGSSGSPVIDLAGDVVALNAAANNKTASSFFLPLPRIKHALERLQAEQDIARGSFQTIFTHQPYRQLRRLGLDEKTESLARADTVDSNGMLVVGQVIPGGVADELLESGDILVSIKGDLITDFIALAELLDDSVGQNLSVEIIRQGMVQELTIAVADLHALEPKRLLEIGDGIVQDMSVQHARAMNREQRGVVVVGAGYDFTRASIPSGAVITSLEGRDISDLDSFVDALQATAQVAKKRVRYVLPGREFSSELGQLEIGERWFDHRLCERVDDARFWNCERLKLAEADPAKMQSASSAPAFRDPILNRIAPAMVKLDFSIPYAAENVYARQFQGIGLIVDKEKGLVVVDRNTVPIGLGDAKLTFFGSLQIPGEVVFVHPRHNIALVQYDVDLLGDADFQSLELSTADTTVPETLTMVGYRADGTFRTHSFDDFSPLTVNLNSPRLPRFQQAAVDVYGVPDVPPSLGGPLVDENGLVHAFYMSFAFEEGRDIQQREWAMPAAVLLESLNMYRSGRPYYSLDAHVSYRPLSIARQLGLPDEWLARYNALPAESRRGLYIDQLVPDTDASEKLASGDMLLAINGELVSDLLATEQLSQQIKLELTLLRAGKVVTVSLSPTALDTLGTQRVVSWAGANFHKPFSDIGYHKGVVFPGVYIADTQNGSPAMWDGLYRNRFVVAIDGKPIETLDDFLTEVLRREQDEITRLTVVSMSGRKRIVTVQPEYNFWPTFEIRRNDVHGWQRINYAHE